MPDTRSEAGRSQPRASESNLENTLDKAPITKVAVIPAGGALSIVLLWLAGLLEIPMTIEVAIAISTLITLGISYMVPERKI